MGEIADAALKFRESLKITSDDPNIYYALGKSYHQLNKHKKSLLLTHKCVYFNILLVLLIQSNGFPS